MKPAPFRYHAAGSVAEVLGLLSAHGDDAKLLAGGQSLVPMMNMRLVRPGVLIDINGVAELDQVTDSPDGLRIGVLTRHRALERARGILGRIPMLSAAAGHIGHVAIRVRGTLGGSIAHADPSAELPAALSALGARIRLVSAKGERTVGCTEFFTGPYNADVGPYELITDVTVPVPPPGTGWSFMEIARRKGDFALAGIAVAIRVGPGGVIDDARLAVIGANPVPARLAAAEAELVGQRAGSTLFRSVAETVKRQVDPYGDVQASAEYRRHLAGVLAVSALEEALRRAVDGRAGDGGR